ncbi:MAG: MerR family transcriptional regulator [Tepidiformaceae bacterium]
MTIGEVAEASGLAADTIRYYERVGVLPKVQRESNAYRGYPPEHVETLRFARRLRELGLAPSDMTDLIRLFHDGTCRQMHQALVERCESTLNKVHTQRLELERVESQLAAVLDGLQHQEVDNHRISTVEPCACVAVIEGDESP